MVAAAKHEVEAAKQEVEAIEEKLEQGVQGEPRQNLEARKKRAEKAWDSAQKAWDSAQQGLDDARAFAQSQRHRLVQLQQSSDAGTLPQHAKHPPTCCHRGNRVYGPLASLLHTVSASHTVVPPCSGVRILC